MTPLKLHTPLVLILCGVLLILVLVDPYKGWTVLFLAFGGAISISYLWARSLAQGLKLKREMRFGWAQVGDQLEERGYLRWRDRCANVTTFGGLELTSQGEGRHDSS